MLPEIVELPRFLCTDTGSNLFLVDEHFDRPQIATEITRIGIRFHQFRRCDLRITLCRGWQTMSEPLLQLEQAHRLLGVEELRRDSGTRPVTGDPTPNVTLWHTRFPAEFRD